MKHHAGHGGHGDEPEGGEVFVTFDNEYNVIMKGSAETICTGEFLK